MTDDGAPVREIGGDGLVAARGIARLAVGAVAARQTIRFGALRTASARAGRQSARGARTTTATASP